MLVTHEAIFGKLLESVKQRVLGMKRYPVSTYRLQFNNAFTFRDATRLIPYLHDLGITDIYASSYLKARPGSQHGYDISDHNSLNPEIGSEEDFCEFVAELHKHGMGQILDFVPNHMSIIDNPWWSDVLENGHGSPYAEFFDIDWYPVRPELREKVLLPVLEDYYGKVLENGGIHLAFSEGTFQVSYHDYRFPIDPSTIPFVFEPCITRLQDSFSKEHPDFLEIQSISTACLNLPSRNKRPPERVAERRREKEIIRRRLDVLYQRSTDVKACLDAVVTDFNGTPGNPSSFDNLHTLLEAQAYRLSYWRVASDEINYRRFFDINELVAIRMENPRVFELTHRLLRELVLNGSVTGVRIDHIDGLRAPADYLHRLQNACILDVCQQEVEAYPDLPEDEQNSLVKRLVETIREDSSLTQPLFVVAEKILVDRETLRKGWPADGTTGYEFGTALNGIFVNRRNAQKVLSIYQWFTGVHDTFKDVVYQSKNLLMRTSLSAEVNVLAHQLDGISEKHRCFRDFTLNSLRDAIREVIACFPIYRTYIGAFYNVVDDEDRTIVNFAIAEAKRRNPAISASVFDFLRDTLLLKYPADTRADSRQDQQLFVMRFQQHSGPVMAKGMEDTAFYIYNPLVSLNEVGGNPGRFGITTQEFHRGNLERLATVPHSIVSTYTHDSKRSEDVRARIDVLSEIPDQWRPALMRWGRMNRRKKASIDGVLAPDRNEEYLLYQTLLGSYPIVEMDEEQHADYLKRVKHYMTKAMREAKVNTSWISPNAEYEEKVLGFIAELLVPSDTNSFLADFLPLNKMVATCGMYNSLAQTVLRVFSPGTPDMYRGSELWDYSLVDPDNRRPVDYDLRMRLLESLKERADDPSALVQEIMGRTETGEVKLYVVWKALNHRRENARLIDGASYIPLEAAGAKKSHIFAFAWRKGAWNTIVIAPRLVARLTRCRATGPLGQQAWGDTRLLLPARARPKSYHNIFTGEVLEIAGDGKPGLPLAQVFSLFPVAVLEPAG